MGGAVTTAGSSITQMPMVPRAHPSMTGSKEAEQLFCAWAPSQRGEERGDTKGHRWKALQYLFSWSWADTHCSQDMITGTPKPSPKKVHCKSLGESWENSSEWPRGSRVLPASPWRCHWWMVFQTAWVIHRLTMLCVAFREKTPRKTRAPELFYWVRMVNEGWIIWTWDRGKPIWFTEPLPKTEQQFCDFFKSSIFHQRYPLKLRGGGHKNKKWPWQGSSEGL